MLNHGRIVSPNWASSPRFAFANIHLMVVYISFRLRWPTFRCRRKFTITTQLMKENNVVGMLIEARAMNPQHNCHQQQELSCCV